MPKYAWVVIGMLSSAVGGEFGVWLTFETIFEFEGQPQDVAANLIGYGGVFAGFAGALVSLRRGDPARPEGWIVIMISLAAGLGLAYLISPAGVLIFLNPFNLLILMAVWPFALLGGLCTLAAIWVSLWLAGVRDSRMAYHDQPASSCKAN